MIKKPTQKLKLKPINSGNINDMSIKNDNKNIIYDNGISVGFRKDKKLYKFVGLRKNFFKQLELSIESVKIDYKEMINSNLFSTLDIDDVNIRHELSGTTFLSKVTKKSLKNMVILESPFNNIDIVYEIHIKGFTIKNNFKKDICIPNKIGQFIICDPQDNSKTFIFERPVIYDKNSKEYRNITHSIYRIGDKYYYKKSIINNKLKTYPLYIDANISINLQYNGTIQSEITNSNIPQDRWYNVIFQPQNLSVNTTQANELILYNNNSSNTSYLTRLFLNFDTTNILDNYVIESVTLDLYVNEPTNFSVCIQKGTQNNILSSSNFNAFQNNPYVISGNTDIILLSGSNYLDLGQQGINDINKNDITKFCIRSYYYDYLYNYLTNNFDSIITFDTSKCFLNIEYVVDINQETNVNINISSSGTGMIYSSGSTWNDARLGNNYLTVNNGLSYYYNAVGSSNSGSIYINTRAFFNFDTSLLQTYNGNVSSLKLNYYSSGSSYIDQSEITILAGDQITNSALTSISYSSYGEYLTTINDTFQNSIGFGYINVNIPTNFLNSTGYTSFALLSQNDYYNYTPSANTSQFHGTNFSSAYLSIVYEPYVLFGQSYKYIYPNSFFTLTAYSNIVNGSNDMILWFTDPNLTQVIGSGGTLTLNSVFYSGVSYLYANIFYNDLPLCANNLVVELIIKDIYPTLFKRSISNNVMDLDAVYWKFNKALSGVCYNYVRDIDNIYEDNVLVNDYHGTGVYNTYTEFDLIDEFYSNVFQAAVALTNNIDLTQKYNKLDNVIMYNGSRVLLTNQSDVKENGVYTVGSILG